MIDLLKFSWPSTETFDHPDSRLVGAVTLNTLNQVIEDDESDGEYHIDPAYFEVVPADDLRDALTLMKSASEKLISQEGGAEPGAVGRRLKEFVDRLGEERK